MWSLSIRTAFRTAGPRRQHQRSRRHRARSTRPVPLSSSCRTRDSITAATGPATGLLSLPTSVCWRTGRRRGTASRCSATATARGCGPAPTRSARATMVEHDPRLPSSSPRVTVAPATATITPGGRRHSPRRRSTPSNQPIAGVDVHVDEHARPSRRWRRRRRDRRRHRATRRSPRPPPNAVAVACTSIALTPPPPGSQSRFSELHYDNFGADAGEAIEVEGPAGTSLAGWSIVLYNGNGGVVYNTVPLSGTIPASCAAARRGGRDVSAGRYSERRPTPWRSSTRRARSSNSCRMKARSPRRRRPACREDGHGHRRLRELVADRPVAAARRAGAWAPAASSFGACNGTGGGPPAGTRHQFTGRAPPIRRCPSDFRIRSSPPCATHPTDGRHDGDVDVRDAGDRDIDQNGVFTGARPDGDVPRHGGRWHDRHDALPHRWRRQHHRAVRRQRRVRRARRRRSQRRLHRPSPGVHVVVQHEPQHAELGELRSSRPRTSAPKIAATASRSIPRCRHRSRATPRPTTRAPARSPATASTAATSRARSTARRRASTTRSRSTSRTSFRRPPT